jgi:hypothetical protein
MAQQIRSLDEIMRELPEELQKEVLDFAEFLLSKRQPQAKGHLSANWRGVLKDMRDEQSAVELKHKISDEWRDEDIA